MICASFGLPSGSGEEAENVEVEQKDGKASDRQQAIRKPRLRIQVR
jgi:hypothetical protein